MIRNNNFAAFAKNSSEQMVGGKRRKGASKGSKKAKKGSRKARRGSKKL